MEMITKELIIEKISQTSKDSYESTEQQLIFDFWEADNLESLNTDYNIDEYVPGFFGIGSDGGDELLIVELSTGKVFSVPFIPLDLKEKVLIANSLDDLIK